MSEIKQLNHVIPQEYNPKSKGNIKQSNQEHVFGQTLLETVEKLEAMGTEIDEITQNPLGKNPTSVSTNVDAVGKLINNIAGLVEDISPEKTGNVKSAKYAVAQYDKMSKTKREET